MLDISFAELALIFVIALVILGPERLPKAARTVGQWVGRARGAFTHLKNELEREAINMDMREKFKEQLKEMGLEDESLKLDQDMMPPEVDAAPQHNTRRPVQETLGTGKETESNETESTPTRKISERPSADNDPS
ncbi:Sec-independent protein translocase protein TatB [Alcanivorax sp. JB21]|uniref:Sec-independent protein translocase protein TatB n=1 Tax=Alcanivorax limicola TaxID=2874102 RepID=UPI001CBEA8A1|nr:Sec-independent protein translocase protein TatB [Alcanivorax limicola]MBZ2189280.1 Sec-independent protein translocase protein TatB [Alcanivorax limicola]